jgi:putative protease
MGVKLKKPELLAPAGDLEKLKIAVHFGADAVYVGGQRFGLRVRSKNFSPEQLREGVSHARARGVKVYVTANIFARGEDFDDMGDYFRELKNIGVDAVIVSDPGVLTLALEIGVNVHISTQANTTNWRSAMFWNNMGAKRVVAARELSFDELADMRQMLPGSFEIEAFAHGAMCVAYSGRCFLSAYMTGRDANAGNCAHACRWKYALVEESRPGEYMPVEQDARGSYILNSRDLCLVGHIPELAAAGVSSLKIEGRVKSPHYVATVVSAYRRAIDDYFNDARIYERNKDDYVNELRKASNRGFTTGFALNAPDESAYNHKTGKYNREYDFLGVVTDYNDETNTAVIEQRGKFSLGDEIEFLRADGSLARHVLTEMSDENGAAITSAPHAQQVVNIKNVRLSKYDIVRKRAL